MIFISVRTAEDDAGYAAAAEAMERLAEEQPGYRGFVGARGDDGVGIAISYWTNEAAALAWRHHPDHARIRDEGRARWYRRYDLSVSTVTRDYAWEKP